MGYRRATIILLLILCFILVTFPNVEIVKAQSTIYIRADGTVEGTDMIQRNGDIYTLIGNISGGIQVQKSYVVLDGAGYALQVNKGEGGRGIDLSNGIGQDPYRAIIVNVTIKNMRIINFNRGIDVVSTSNNTIIGNYIADCSTGINIIGRQNNVLIKNNTIVNSFYNPIAIAYGGGNMVITENSFIEGTLIIVSLSPEPDVDKNYWSDYNGTDADGDGIGDTPYVYGVGGDPKSNYFDEHPLMEPVPVIPEFPSWAILPILVISTLIILGLRNKIRLKPSS